jgi:hypothetical protein
MACRTLRMALLVGAVTAAVVSPARAYHMAPCCNEPCGAHGAPAPCAPAPAPAPAAPAFRTITVTECVPETYTIKRTAYKFECRTEEYDTCRTECVPEVRERTCTYVKKVPVVKTEVRKVCKNVTTYEERTVMKSCYQTVQETCMKKELVRLGHWECREVPARTHPFHKKDCCDPCDPCCAPPTRTKKVWVHCPEYCEKPVTVCKKVCVQVPTVCKVPVCRQVWENVCVQVCTYQCVTETRCEKYTCMVARQVPCKATRTVRVCVPYEETVTCCRMVPRTREVQVPVTNECCPPAPACCESTSRHHGGGMFRGHRGSGCDCH